MLAYQSIIAWIVIGGVAGWVAGLLVEGYGFGLIGNVVIGILGASVAGVLMSMLGFYTHSIIGNLIVATIGALLLLGLIGLVRRI